MDKLWIFSFIYFLGMSFFGGDGFQNMFVYQPAFSTLNLKEGKGSEYVKDSKTKKIIEFYTTSVTYCFLA